MLSVAVRPWYSDSYINGHNMDWLKAILTSILNVQGVSKIGLKCMMLDVADCVFD